MYLGCGRQNQASKKLSTTRGIPNIHCKAHPVCFWRLGKNVTCARKVGRLKSLLRAIRFWITSCRKDDLLGDPANARAREVCAEPSMWSSQNLQGVLLYMIG